MYIISHTQIVDWLNNYVRQKMHDKPCQYYDNIENIPSIMKSINHIKEEHGFSIEHKMPVDFICEEKMIETDDNGNPNEYLYFTIYLVISTNKVPDINNDRILFYKFFLSRVISPKRLKIIMVAPKNIKGINEDFHLEHGIGLWKFINNDTEPEEIFKAITLRDLMEKEFTKSKPENIFLFFDKYIHDAVKSIAGIKPEQIGKRYISRKIMDKVFKFENISYNKELFKVINEHLTDKGDEYQLASEIFSSLWKNHIGIPYSNLLKNFEPILLNIFSGTGENEKIYRDHYLHQLQVFLLGLFIIDNIYDRFSKKYKNPELSWLIASSFHDMAYPVQLYDEWSGQFFYKVFDLPKDKSKIEFKPHFIEKGFMNCVSSLIVRFCKVLLNQKLSCSWLPDKDYLLQFFHKSITEKKNHGVLSSISLLKLVNKNEEDIVEKMGNKNKISFKNICDKIILPSALAIAIHDYGIWNNMKKDKILPYLNFDDDPLSFLLILCDNIQEWGRPSKSFGGIQSWDKFRLKDITYDPDMGFDIKIESLIEDKVAFRGKIDEFNELQLFLQQPKDINFVIHIEDMSGKQNVFIMKGAQNCSLGAGS